MLNSASLKVINSSKFSQRFVRPRYDSYCFSNIPATIQSLLTGEGHHPLPPDVLGDAPSRYDNVIFFFIDAFGWRFFERYAEKYPILKTILEQGIVSKLTSQFPSTTAAHVTCVHTGQDVGQSGVYEWNYYEPLVDDVISPLLFSYSRDKLLRDTLKRSEVPPASFFPKNTFYQQLDTYGVQSHILQHEAYTTSTYSDIVFRGAQVHPYRTLQDAFTCLEQLVTSTHRAPHAAPAYYFFYFDRIDTICHNYGPTSKQTEETIENFMRHLEELILTRLRGQAGNTLFMMTADHGQVEVNPHNTFYINREVPAITRMMKVNHRGQVLAPAGSARDMFLHIREEHIDTAIGELRQRLTRIAEVYKTQDLLKQNFFGLEPPSRAFLDRVGNVVILPYKRETVWWYEETKFSMHFYGHHGGMTPEEMEIPLLLLPLA